MRMLILQGARGKGPRGWGEHEWAEQWCRVRVSMVMTAKEVGRDSGQGHSTCCPWGGWTEYVAPETACACARISLKTGVSDS